MTSFLDAKGIAAQLPRPNLTPTPTPTVTVRPITRPPVPPRPEYIDLTPDSNVPNRVTMETMMSPGFFLSVRTPPDGAVPGSVGLVPDIGTNAVWAVQRSGDGYIMGVSLGKDAPPGVLAAGPGTDCGSAVLWNQVSGIRSQFVISRTPENLGGVVISTVAQKGMGGCKDNRIRFLVAQANGSIRMVVEPPTLKTLDEYVWVLRAPPATPTDTPTPTPTGTFSPTPTATAMPDININISNPGANPFPYPVSPNLLIGGVVDPLLMNPTVLPTTAPPATTGPATTGPATTAPPAFVQTAFDEDDDESLFPTATPAPKWTWKRILMYVAIAAIVGVALYFGYRYYKKGGAGGNNNSLGGANNGGFGGRQGGNNNFGNLGNLNLGNNGNANLANLGAPPPTAAAAARSR